MCSSSCQWRENFDHQVRTPNQPPLPSALFVNHFDQETAGIISMDEPVVPDKKLSDLAQEIVSSSLDYYLKSKHV